MKIGEYQLSRLSKERERERRVDKYEIIITLRHSIRQESVGVKLVSVTLSFFVDGLCSGYLSLGLCVDLKWKWRGGANQVLATFQKVPRDECLSINKSERAVVRWLMRI